ncbi:MAG: polysaccharide biosynthesis tyrosine autokinase [Flavobacteriales bacterium]|nr:polysaccharide biosynthesis tyrosine autokinase [Flavobacteriales bacterium]
MSQTGAQESVDLKAIFSKIVSKWWLFLITISIAVAGGAAYIKTTPKAYRVKSVLRMSEGRRSNFGGNKEEFLKGSGYLKSDAELEDEIAMIRSVSIMTRTLSKLDFAIGYYGKKNFLTKELYDVSPFVVQMDSSVLQMCALPIYIKVDTAAHTYNVKVQSKNVVLYDLKKNAMASGYLAKVDIDRTLNIDQPFVDEHLSFRITLPKERLVDGKTEYFFYLNSLDELLRQWQGSTSVDPMSEESNIVILSTSGEVISKQKKFLDMLMATYIEGEQEKNNKKGEATIAFIEAALGHSGLDLQKAQSNLQNAQTGGSLGDAAGQGGAINQELYRQQDEEGRLKSQLASLNGLISTMSYDNGGTPNTIATSGINSSSLTPLIDKYNQDVAKLIADQGTVKIATAPVIALRRTVQTERAQIVQSAQALVSQTQNDLASVQQRLGQLRGQLYALPGQEAKRRIAARSYELSEGINNYLMEKSYEAQIAVNSDQVDKTVVDAARPESPAPIAPDKKVVLGGAFALGLLIPLLFILGMDLINDKIGDVDELKRLTSIPILATIPNSKRKRITPDEPKSLLAESFRTARINLQYLNADEARQVVGMTSSTSGEGKTFCAINLATIMAISGKRTLLIDADMRRPRVQDYLELPDGAGLSTLLIGECSIDQAIRRSGVQGLDVITAGPIPPNPLELVESPRMSELFATIRGRYDQIIVDASPMGLVSEFKIIVGYVDITLYVVRQGYTRRGMLRGVNELHKGGKMTRVDMLLNDVKGGGGDGYGYYTK